MLISFILILLAVALYGWVHSLLASLHIKERIRERFGEHVARYYRLTYNLFAVLSLLPVFALARLLPDTHLYTFPMPWAVLAVGVQFLAVVALGVGVLQTGVWSFVGLSPLVKTGAAKKPRLVTHGLYRYVRHPLYSAGLVFLWFTPIMTANLLALYIGFSLYLIFGARVEERKLLSEFGSAYQSYKDRTPMFIPGLKNPRPSQSA